MFKKLIMAAVIVGSGASVPLLYESNPEAFNRLVTGTPEPTVEVTASVNPQDKGPVSGTLSGRSHKIGMDSQGHFRDEFKLNGRRMDALVDTGATLVAINRTTARQIGIKLEPADFKFKVNTANGTTRAASAVIARMQIGRIDLENIEVVILEDKALSGTLVGMSFLKRLDSFKVEGKELVMKQ